MSSASGMCQAYPVYTFGAPEDVSTALHGSGEGSLCTKVHASPACPLYSCTAVHDTRQITQSLYTTDVTVTTQIRPETSDVELATLE